MRALDVGIDLDGVGYGFVSCLAAWARDHGHPDAAADTWREWDGFTSWGLDRAGFVAMCHAAADSGHLFASQAPLPGFAEMMHELRDDGHRLHVVTARDFGSAGASQRATRSWLAANAIPFDTLTFSRDKTVVPVSAFLEDNLDNYDALDAVGHRPYLIKWEYNDLDDVPRRRVENHAEFAAAVRELAA